MDRPATMTSRTQEENEALAAAARESMRRQIRDLLTKRNLTDSPDLVACPRCGERAIIESERSTWIKDRASGERICAACGAEVVVLDIVMPGVEIGGEG